MPKERRSRFSNPVVVLADPDSAARYGQWIQSLLICLVDEGLNPMLVAPPETLLTPAVPEQAIIRLTCPRAGYGLVRHWASRSLLDQLAAEPVRLVLAMSGRLARYGGWLAGQLGVPLAAAVMGEDEVAPVVSTRARLACVFAGSSSLADGVRDHLGDEAADVVQQVGLGVHVGPHAVTFCETGRACGILGAGPLEHASGFDQLISAWAHLSERHYDAVYFIIGSGPAERSLRRLARTKGLTDRLTFVPDLRGLKNLYSGIDVFVQPFLCRRLDLRLLEAMAAGAVVLARNGGALDIVRDGVNGVALTQGDEAELTMLLQRLLDEPALGRRIGASARQFVQSNHLAGTTVQAVVGRIKELVLSQQTLKLETPAEQPAETGP